MVLLKHLRIFKTSGRGTSATRGHRARPAPVEPDPAATPEQTPEEEGGGSAQLSTFERVNACVDQAGIDQRATDPQPSTQVNRKPMA